MNSADSSSKPSTLHQSFKWLAYAIVAIGFIGFLDASYLTISHYRGTDVGCSLTNGCEEVLNSGYSTIFGIPIALFGALFYLAVFILALLFTDLKKPLIPKILAALTGTAFLFSAFLVYLQFFVIKALCQYCLVSAGLSTLLFIFSLTLMIKCKPKSSIIF